MTCVDYPVRPAIDVGLKGVTLLVRRREHSLLDRQARHDVIGKMGVVSIIRQVSYEGQTQGPLQENATKESWPQTA